ncbi:MAG TPA: 4Fe-4S dicluster domain-containing protein [Methanothermobacter sp.]|jgi:ferredoxin|uniref:4Fe-4S ferredoxin n=1 Tax=Methanothermobacter tenebrarum TaxID=680118 RepID=A0ABM7YDL0_9EURY|nr:4Fe-4S dicluster domain-containing protein [Methanothermobacter tenebrarum]MDI6881610.1 4Fe-4S dicluster domain-containing protein [Methanothermobacter sp.]MDX9693548.1 4Fe-4S dicluster domain-containing protein [Methanothermobacter sp.]BDH79419.1 4Fe-4S ferredoxin [Methanothermobacter tenebrarum]HHW16060.1 4Fe-4S dicluster domain-containing protein [Methanothermobacter sp.]HOQ19493.1 4Fe-4S dicluster domain-containing protein [Methanothermobacter sp.]
MLDFTDISIRVIKLTFKGRFRLARLAKRSKTFRRIVHRLFFEGDDIQALPRDETITLNVKVDPPNTSILPSQVLKEMISKSRYIFRMNFCICRVSSNCRDYPHRLGCLFLGKGANRISKKVGRLISKDEAIAHIEECEKAGLVHIIGRNKIDTVWLNTGPKEELLSICNCCPCCCLWKMIPELPEELARSITPMSGVKLKFKRENCIGCGDCLEKCFIKAIKIKNGKAQIDNRLCRCCGRCAMECENDAIRILVDPDAVERAIGRMEPLVDVKAE